MSLADMVILDLKYPTEELYQYYVKGSLSRTLEVLDYALNLGKEVWVRTVVIPGVNDSEEMIDKYVALLAGKKIAKYELLAFHTMGFFKYEELGIENRFKDKSPLREDRLRELQAYADAKLALAK